MYFNNEHRSGRGIATMVLRQLGERVGFRERSILEAPDVTVCRWSGGSDCLEFKAGDSACVIRRGDLAIVG